MAKKKSLFKKLRKSESSLVAEPEAPVDDAILEAIAKPKIEEVVRPAIVRKPYIAPPKTYPEVVDIAVNKNDILWRTIQVLSHHIGQALSYHQISELIQVDNETVERYIHLLIDAHLLYKIPCYNTDQRYELKKTHIFIFMDNGIRNAVINNFNSLTMRIDLDALWKNWLIAERIKWNSINGRNPKYYFWRSHTRQQIDLIEIGEKGMEGFNFRFEKKKMIKTSPLFSKYYPTSAVHTVNKSTYLTFLTKK